MGRATIRAAATAYLQSKQLPFLGTVFPARPSIVDENDYDANMSQQLWNEQGLPDEGSSAILIVNITTSRRERRASTGRSAVNDTDIHSIVLELFFANTGGTDNQQQGIQAQTDHDQLCDALVVLLRADPLLGQSQTVWSAGEFQAGIEVEQHEPFNNEDGTTVFIVSTIRFETWEWISGTNV